MKDLQKNVTAVYEILSDVYPVSPWSEKQILSDMQQENVDYFFIEKNGEIEDESLVDNTSYDCENEMIQE